ncbi:MAG: hypothetical protein HY782_00535 [Chloroflexi bacterium]|nr:hypothetical protein [Chloroflexota bacterium]
MAIMIRKQIYINKQQEATLKRQAKELGTTEAELIRQAIDRQVTVRLKPDRTLWRKEREYIQKLIAQGPVPGKRTWRREDAYGRR